MGKITSILEKRIILCASTAQMMPKRNYRSRGSFPAGIYLLKVNNKNIRTMWNMFKINNTDVDWVIPLETT